MSTPAGTGSLVFDYFSYFKAILARTLFGTHAVVTVWRTTVLMGYAYWTLAFGVFLLVIEYFVTMWVRMGSDWPWISPSTLCYLATTASALWVQKLQSLGHVVSLNESTVASVPGLNTKLDFSASEWLLLTEQTMMVTIILSRWLLPKGDMTHTDLSSLLLLYLGLSADILDFSTIFNEEKIAADEIICYVILVIWTGSLCQFFLVLTNTSKVEDESVSLRSLICSSEVWQILVQAGLQDLPFLLIRVLALLQYEVFNFTIIFFVCKNTLVISLEIYHLVAVCRKQKRKLKRRRDRVSALRTKMVSVKDAIKAINGMPSSKLRSDKQKDAAPTGLQDKTGIGDENGGDVMKNGSGFANAATTAKKLVQKKSSSSTFDSPTIISPTKEILKNAAIDLSANRKSTISVSDVKVSASDVENKSSTNSKSKLNESVDAFQILYNGETLAQINNFKQANGSLKSDLRRGTPPLWHKLEDEVF